VRGIIRRLSAAGQSEQASDILVNMLVNYAARAANNYRPPAEMIFNPSRQTSYA